MKENKLALDKGINLKKELVIIGGGPAGLAAALSAYENGIKDILILERDQELGGILNQCIHNGFGLHTFGQELTGPEYAIRYIDRIQEQKIPYFVNTMVVGLENSEDGEAKIITAMGGQTGDQPGILRIAARAVILAMGCRERARGALNIPGFRPAGIYSAGTAQRYVNIEGRMPGRQVVVLGSGDIGLIMARRMKLQGAEVKMVAEIMPYSGGLKRNIVQCLEDFGIPLKLSHTVIDIQGRDRLTGVTVARVDEKGKPVSGTEEQIACDTLLLSCGLIPENELTWAAGMERDSVTGGPIVNRSLETTVRGVFACGNVLHVHDLVDNVSGEAQEAGQNAARYLLQGGEAWGQAVRPKIPPKSRFAPPENWDAEKQLICIGCPAGCLITVENQDNELVITGNSCHVGAEYARKEMTAPSRIVTSLVRVSGGKRTVVSVKTAADIPKGKIAACMEEINKTQVTSPVCVGDVIIANVAGTGVDVVATIGNDRK